MVIPVVGDLLLLTFRGTLYGQRVMNTFWYSLRTLNLTNTPTLETLSNQINVQMGLGSAWLAAYRDCLSENYQINQLWVQRVFPTRIMKEVYDVDDAGTHTDTGLTANMQASIMRRTEVASPGNIGGVRIALPNDVTACSNGFVTGAYKAKLQAFANKMDDIITCAVGTDIEPVLPTRLPPVPPAKQGVIDGSRDIARITVMDTVRTLSRRTVGRGE